VRLEIPDFCLKKAKKHRQMHSDCQNIPLLQVNGAMKSNSNVRISARYQFLMKSVKLRKPERLSAFTVCPIQDYWQHILILSAAGKFYLPGYPLRLPHSSTSKFDGVVIFCLNLGTLSSVCIFSLPWYMSVQVELILS